MMTSVVEISFSYFKIYEKIVGSESEKKKLLLLN